MYTKEQIAAVIISYNGDNFEKNIAQILKQVDKIIIVDNGSNNVSRLFLRGIQNSKITINYCNCNLGQATALNIGVDIAHNLGYCLVLTMDQDSIICDNCVDKLLNAINLGYDSAGPNYLNKNKNQKIWQVRYLITSGNLLKIEAIIKSGGFEEKLFIDSVDFDISLKLRMHGYKLAMVGDAKMTHVIGKKHQNKSKKIIMEHAPERYYYMARNHRYIIHKYWRYDPIFCIKKAMSFFHLIINIAKESDCANKYKHAKRGYEDFRTVYGNSEYIDVKRDKIL